MTASPTTSTSTTSTSSSSSSGSSHRSSSTSFKQFLSLSVNVVALAVVLGVVSHTYFVQDGVTSSSHLANNNKNNINGATTTEASFSMSSVWQGFQKMTSSVEEQDDDDDEEEEEHDEDDEDDKDEEDSPLTSFSSYASAGQVYLQEPVEQARLLKKKKKKKAAPASLPTTTSSAPSSGKNGSAKNASGKCGKGKNGELCVEVLTCVPLPGPATAAPTKGKNGASGKNGTSGKNSSPAAAPASAGAVSDVSEPVCNTRKCKKARAKAAAQAAAATTTTTATTAAVATVAAPACTSRKCKKAQKAALAAASAASTTTTTTTTTTTKHDATTYQCPAVAQQDDKAINFDPIRFANHYLRQDDHTVEMEDFIANFRDTQYDDWGLSYTRMKEGMTPWKQRAFVPHIQSGDKIYESAIGQGLNAYMTLELLREQKPSLQGVSLYGNEYLLASTVRANEFFDRLLPAVNVQKGNICVGDSTNISYVPSNSFDLVYTGYILPIGNPLQFDQPDKDPFSINHGRYHELCDGTEWRDVTLRELAQRKQEDFYAAWTGEMIRIAKPGHPIIVEHVSQPKCDDRDDWGGVAKSWWYEAIERYNWPIDPDSIFMEDDHIYAFSRYHVFMRKTSAQGNIKNVE